MGSNTVFGHVVTIAGLKAPRYKTAALFLLLLVLCDRRAFAQSELVGTWAARNTEDVSRDSYPVDYLGLPLNEEGRLRALSYNEAQLAMVERQCIGWPPFYFVQGPFGLKIWSDNEPVKGTVVSYTIGAWEDRAPIVIWMDGRPHPSENAEHTRGGFTTGKWEGDTLVAYTTHMKAGLLRKNGPPSSDQATMTTRFWRHGETLTVLAVVEDPAYLAEPHIITKSFQLATAPMSPVGPPCVSTFEGKRPGDSTPHYVPEKNPFVDELTTMWHLPKDAVLGQAETLYPEYRKKIKSTYVPLEPCKRDCGAVPPR